jgi:hypothetical protein
LLLALSHAGANHSEHHYKEVSIEWSSSGAAH